MSALLDVISRTWLARDLHAAARGGHCPTAQVLIQRDRHAIRTCVEAFARRVVPDAWIGWSDGPSAREMYAGPGLVIGIGMRDNRDHARVDRDLAKLAAALRAYGARHDREARYVRIPWDREREARIEALAGPYAVLVRSPDRRGCQGDRLDLFCPRCGGHGCPPGTAPGESPCAA